MCVHTLSRTVKIYTVWEECGSFIKDVYCCVATYQPIVWHHKWCCITSTPTWRDAIIATVIVPLFRAFGGNNHSPFRALYCHTIQTQKFYTACRWYEKIFCTTYFFICHAIRCKSKVFSVFPSHKVPKHCLYIRKNCELLIKSIIKKIFVTYYNIV